MLISKSATQAGAGSGLQQLVSLISESRHTYIPVSLHVSVTETDKHPRVSMFVQLFLVQLVLCNNNDSVLNEPDRLFKDICAFCE